VATSKGLGWAHGPGYYAGLKDRRLLAETDEAVGAVVADKD
jgi:hypothetical protein